ncbi:MAG TPA: type II toxin-antitoxin system death-on-curing family toxin [Chthonomonadaceae bacterium]|nr:type II toxin-antitoxin system death-on-curing family toxin [Chthonomonadaceae bacterium]
MADIDEEEHPSIWFLTREQTLILHRQGIERYTPGEPLDIVNNANLESALAQPQATLAGQFLYDSAAKMAAAYMFSFASNHAFLQGNKRLALSASTTFLRMNGYRLALTDDEAADLILQIATGEIEQDQAAEIVEGAIEIR